MTAPTKISFVFAVSHTFVRSLYDLAPLMLNANYTRFCLRRVA